MSKSQQKRQAAFREKAVQLVKDSGAITLASEGYHRFSLPNRKTLPMEVSIFTEGNSTQFSIYFRAGTLFERSDIQAAYRILSAEFGSVGLNEFNLKWNIHEETPEAALNEAKRRIDFLMEGKGELILPLERMLR